MSYVILIILKIHDNNYSILWKNPSMSTCTIYFGRHLHQPGRTLKFIKFSYEVFILGFELSGLIGPCNLFCFFKAWPHFVAGLIQVFVIYSHELPQEFNICTINIFSQNKIHYKK